MKNVPNRHPYLRRSQDIRSQSDLPKFFLRPLLYFPIVFEFQPFLRNILADLAFPIPRCNFLSGLNLMNYGKKPIIFSEK